MSVPSLQRMESVAAFEEEQQQPAKNGLISSNCTRQPLGRTRDRIWVAHTPMVLLTYNAISDTNITWYGTVMESVLP